VVAGALPPLPGADVELPPLAPELAPELEPPLASEPELAPALLPPEEVELDPPWAGAAPGGSTTLALQASSEREPPNERAMRNAELGRMRVIMAD
jgi:hypothetical protein